MTSSRLSVAIAMAFCTAPAFAQAPANDNCTGATPLMLGINPTDSTAATDGTGLALDPGVCDMGMFGDEQIHADIWYTFTPATTGDYNFIQDDIGNPPFDGRIAIYDQASCPDVPANVIDCADDIAVGNVRAGMFGVALTAGTTYTVRFGSYGPFTAEQPAAIVVETPPVNDSCSGALLAMAGSNPFNPAAATQDGQTLDPSVCSFGFGSEDMFQDTWYLFTAPASGGFDIEIVNNGFGTYDGRLAVYDQSTCPDDPANVIACDDDDGEGLLPQALSVPMTMGNTYLIRIGTFLIGTDANPADLVINQGAPPPTPPANDDCANAEVITAHGTYSFDNGIATSDGPNLAGLCDYGLGDDINHSNVWFEYTPSVGGCTYISTLGLAGFDSRIAIFDTSSCPVDPALFIACSDEEVQGPITTPFEAGMDVVLTAGSTYLIEVGTFSATTIGGAGALLIGPGPMADLNDGGMQSGAPGCGAVPPGPTFPDFCNGDGGDGMGCTECPCGNNALSGTIGGCVNSSGGSTRLAASGDPSVSLPSMDTTDLRFTVTGSPPNATNVLLSGNAVAPANMASPCFGTNAGILSGDRDGLRCAVQATVRHGNRSANAMGEIMDPTGPSRVWGGEAQPVDGLAVQGGFASGQTRYFQITHRDDVLAVCMRGLNTSQAVQVTFTP